MEAGATYSTGVSADSFLSIVVLGYLVDCLLMGVVLTLAYFQNFPNHRTVIQRMVQVILAFCVAQTIANIISCTSMLGLHDDPLALFDHDFRGASPLAARLCNPFLMGVAHVLLCHRCLAFTHSLRIWDSARTMLFRSALWAATLLCWILGLTGIVIIYSAFKKHGIVLGPVPELVQVGHYCLIGNLVSASVLDSVIAAVMIWELRQNKSAFEGTKSVVETMTRVLVANGLLLTVYQLAVALAYAFGHANGASGLTVVANDLIGKVYAVTSLLAICRPLEAERLRNNPAAYGTQRSRTSTGTSSPPPSAPDQRMSPSAALESSALQSSGARRRSSMRPAGEDEEAAADGALEVKTSGRSASSELEVDEKAPRGSQPSSSAGSSASDVEGIVATLRFVEQPLEAGDRAPLSTTTSIAASSPALPVNVYGQPKFSLGPSRGPSRPSTAPSSYGSRGTAFSSYDSPPTPVRTIPGMNDHGLDLDYICAPMEADSVVRASPAPSRQPSPRLFD